MKKTMVALVGLMMTVATVFSSCGQKAEEIDTKAKTPAAKTELKLAYVLIDTLTSQYERCKDLEAEFNTKRANAEKEVQTQGNSFQSQVQEFQRKVQQNQFTQEQFEKEQARLAQRQQVIENLSANLMNQLQEEYQTAFKALTDTIQSFATQYAKTKGYDFIFCKSSSIDNVLYADPQYDITAEVVTALNKLYAKEKKAPAKKDAKADEKKDTKK